MLPVFVAAASDFAHENFGLCTKPGCDERRMDNRPPPRPPGHWPKALFLSSPSLSGDAL